MARYMWLYVYGGVYVDLDVEATGRMTKHLRGVQLALPQNSTQHAIERGCWAGVRPRPPVWPYCHTHIGNWWMASVAGHPLWIQMLSYVAKNVDFICKRKRKHYDVLELTGPYGLGRVVVRRATSLAAESTAQNIMTDRHRIVAKRSHVDFSTFGRSGTVSPRTVPMKQSYVEEQSK